jgi:hypothetical protein
MEVIWRQVSTARIPEDYDQWYGRLPGGQELNLFRFSLGDPVHWPQYRAGFWYVHVPLGGAVEVYPAEWSLEEVQAVALASYRMKG